MTDTDNTAANQGDLTALRLPELRKIAGELGLRGVSALRKGDLINAIATARSGGSPAQPTQQAGPAKDAPAAPATRTRRATRTSAPEKGAEAAEAPAPDAPVQEAQETQEAPARRGRRRVTASPSSTQSSTQEETGTTQDTPTQDTPTQDTPTQDTPAQEAPAQQDGQSASDGDDQDNRMESRSAARRARRNRQRQSQRDTQDSAHGEQSQDETTDAPAERSERSDQTQSDDNQSDSQDRHRGNQRRDRRGNRSDNQQDQGDNQSDSRDNSQNNRQGNRDSDDHGDDRRGRRGRRNRRGRDRSDNRDNRDNRNENQQDQGDNQNDDQLQNVAGILDIVDTNVAFVRTTGYHPAPSDVFVNNQLIRRMGLRSGDAIVGQVRMNQGGNQGGRQGGHGGRNRQKYNNLVRVETINGLPVEEARNRPEFNKLTPLYPNQRLRLETEPKILTTRVIDLIMPIGKGQRALIVSPPKAGKTTILQNIANAIATNNPECYLMVVLVDERPEEVTDMQRSVKGEVIASTFDRPPSEHTAVAELAIERAKRLVEQGQDVVVLLDSITRLGRAYNNSSPASGRILSGGVDSNALYPPKRFLGAARNIENGGSLTIIATAMVETGSAGDTVIFEEFKGTGNAELKLDRKISERRVFPAVDVNPSGTRKDELLLNPDEARIMHKLRRILSALDNQQAIDLLIKQLKKTKSNAEFLMQVASSAPMAGSENDEEYS
ncbi:transcription termination factor Rho [Corynebacterium efficiens]|uniref:transcription termination factor Rho n=1 Tax=Corynebacterium efficiens TaxID=152794 RepID=UPI0003200DE8|nr:transcription termination factor Rho [Corynebacterium efficiens]